MFAILAVILPFWSKHAIFNGGLGQKKSKFERKTSGLGKKMTKNPQDVRALTTSGADTGF